MKDFKKNLCFLLYSNNIANFLLKSQISQLFGGLGICSLEAVVARDGKEYIIEVNDCATTLMGESQEEDRKNITELVIKEMEVSYMNTCGQILVYKN